MNDQNPYAVTDTRISEQHPESSKYDLARVHKYLKWVLWSVVGLLSGASGVILQEMVDLIPVTLLWLPRVVVVASYIGAMIAGLLLISAVSKDRRAPVVLGFFALIPCIGLFVVGGICQYAVALLRQNGTRFEPFRT